MERVPFQNITVLMSLLDYELTNEEIIDTFELTKDEAIAFKKYRHSEGNFKNNKGVVEKPNSAEFLQNELPFLVLPIFRLLGNRSDENATNAILSLSGKLSATQVDSTAQVQFFLQMGDLFMEEKRPDVSVEAYRTAAYICKEAKLPKSIFFDCVCGLSKADFFRGVNPIETAKLQKEAISLFNEDAPSATEALILLYASLVQHFIGNETEGFQMGEKAIQWLNSMQVSQLVHNMTVPLIGWHIYLSGRFRDAIDYYEDMIIAIENRMDTEVATLAYPPIIYSYIFLGEYHKAMILNEIIYRRALERNDYATAILMHCIEGRIHVAYYDNDNGAVILYEALTEARQKGFIWGQYYALCALCQMHLNLEQSDSCYEDLMLMSELKTRYHIGRMYSSPFILDVLKILEESGHAPVRDMGYVDELYRHIQSDNVHMKGVSYRHIALLKKAEHVAYPEIMELLKKSEESLKCSGNSLELGRTYIEMARIMKMQQKQQESREYATSAWAALGSNTYKYFPNELSDLVKVGKVTLDIGVSLEVLGIELHHITNGRELLLKMVTNLSRILNVESGAAAIFANGIPQIEIVQNMDVIGGSKERQQKVLGWFAYSNKVKRSVIKVNAKASSIFWPDFDTEPSFMMVLPICYNDEICAAIYLESYYRKSTLSADESSSLDAFASSVAPHVAAAINYGRAAQNKEQFQTVDERKTDEKDICVGPSDNMKQVMETIALVSKTEVSVLLQGETGVGKEIFAHEIYRESGCRGAFVKVNCGAIPETLIESELFGYEKGSFTGAFQTHHGYFEAADGGTIFLDEIGELPSSAQRKLLRVLQEREIVRVGGTTPIKVKFRLIAATNKNLQDEVVAGRFRSDLFYRIAVVPIEIASLRERKSDIPELLYFFMEKYKNLTGRFYRVSECEMDALMNYSWPGNARELENIVQRAMLLSSGTELSFSPFLNAENGAALPIQTTQLKTLDEIEKDYIMHVLNVCKGKIGGSGGAAEILGLKRTTLISKMEKLGISVANMKQ